MKKLLFIFFFTLFFNLLLSCEDLFASADHQLKIKIDLGPAGGNFLIKSEHVLGEIRKTDTDIAAKKLWVTLNTLSSDLEIRDVEMRKYLIELGKMDLNTPESLQIGLRDVRGRKGRATGLFFLGQLKKVVTIQYQILTSSRIKAKFNLDLSNLGPLPPSYLGAFCKNLISIEAILEFKDLSTNDLAMNKTVIIKPEVVAPRKKQNSKVKIKSKRKTKPLKGK